MSYRYKTSDIAKLTGLTRYQVLNLVKRQGISTKKNKNDDNLYNDEAIELIKMYFNLKKEGNISYKELKLLEKLMEYEYSKTQGIQKVYNILVNYDCTANYIHTLKLFYICCNSILGYSDKDKELVEEVTGDINVYPHENETLQSMYNYYLYQARVIDLVTELSKLELDADTDEFWNNDVVEYFLTYIINIKAKSLQNSKRIDKFYISYLIPNMDFESMSNSMIEKLNLLLEKLNQFFNHTGLEYERCKHIFIHAIMLLSVSLSINTVNS